MQEARAFYLCQTLAHPFPRHMLFVAENRSAIEHYQEVVVLLGM